MTVGALAVEGIADLLRRRLGRGLDGWLQGPDASIRFQPGAEWSVATEDRALTLSMPAATAEALADALKPVVGTYEVAEAPGLVVVVEETIVRDQTGAEIRRVG